MTKLLTQVNIQAHHKKIVMSLW